MAEAFDVVLRFWFEEIEPNQWWVKEPAFDQQIRERFGAWHNRAVACECFSWRMHPRGRLAEIIILDQFSRNIFRDSADAFRQDPQALALAQEAVSQGVDRQLTAIENSFLYMPYMHSESLLIHNQAVELYRRNGIESNLDFEYKHHQIIQRYGRYPHRNAVLGRPSTAEELAFLAQPDSAF